jgi:hypothetical protein
VSDQVPIFTNGDSVRVMQTPTMERLGWDGVVGFVLTHWMNRGFQKSVACNRPATAIPSTCLRRAC